MARENQPREKQSRVQNVPEGKFDELQLRQAPARPRITRPRHCCVHEFWAVVETDGSLVRGRNVTKVTKLATGTYEVLFSRNVSNGVFLGTLGRPGIFTEPPGESTLALRAGSNDKGIWINTFDSNGPSRRPRLPPLGAHGLTTIADHNGLQRIGPRFS